jgi:eukaryotic-like serine/threonine-protein kinase
MRSDPIEPTTPRVLRAHDISYTVDRVLMSHPDYGLLLLATREPRYGGTREPVTLRPVPPGPAALERVKEEVRLSRYLRHPNVASVDGWFSAGGTHYVVMEYVRGCTLLSLLHAAMLTGHGLPPELAAFIAAEVAHGLDHAHGRLDEQGHALRIVHRAVSPMRILVGRNGRIKLTYFGSAWSELRHRLLTPPTLLRGDVAYMAPEILRGLSRPLPKHFDRRADLFSLGLVLLEMLTQCHPLDAPDVSWRDIPALFPAGVIAEQPAWLELQALADRVLHFGPEQVARLAHQLPPALQHVVSRALRSEPSERYQTAGEMRDELQAYIQSQVGRLGAQQVARECRRLIQAARGHDSLPCYSLVEKGLWRATQDVEAAELY